MSIRKNAELKTLKEWIIQGMMEFMDVADVNYEKVDVEECGRILDEHVDTISKAEDRDSAMECVKATVLKLNELNEKTGHELIETDQREDICAHIIRAGALLGFNEEEEDVTEEWREW